MTVAFEPEPIRRRRRLPDRAALAVAIAIVLVGLAVLKPWSTGSPAAASPSPSAGSSSSAVDPAIGSLAVADILDAVPVHDAWGLRVIASPLSGVPPGSIAHLPGGARLIQRWTAMNPVADAPAGSFAAPFPAPGAIVADAGGPIRYLGLTSPARDPALDVRVWRMGPDVEEPRWLDVRLGGGDLGLGEWLLGPPWAGGAQLPEWPSGTYLIEVLRAGPIGRLTVRVPVAPSRPVSVPEEPPHPGADPTAGGGLPSLAEIRPVGFVVADGQAVTLPGRLGPPLDERASWLAAASTSTDAAPAVVHGHVPGATGIGLMFPSRATAVAATLVRLAPAFDASFPSARIGSVGTADGDVPWAIVDAPANGSFPPGSYRLDVTWRDGSGDRSYAGSIHLELEPGPLGIVPRWLSAARGMAHWAGQEGFVVGISARIEGASTDSLMRLLPERPGTAPVTVEALGDTCPGAVLAESGDAVLGLAHAALRAPTSVGVEELLPGGARRAVPVRAALDVVPGLVLLSPDGTWPGGRFLVTLAGPSWVERSVACFGGPGPPLRVPTASPSPAP